MARLGQLRADASAYQYVQIRTHRAQQDAALSWLEKALRLRDPGLRYVKFDPLLDPWRERPLFRAVEQALKFPR